MERSEIRGSTTRFPDGAEPISGPAWGARRGAGSGQGRLIPLAPFGLDRFRAITRARDHDGAGSR